MDPLHNLSLHTGGQDKDIPHCSEIHGHIEDNNLVVPSNTNLSPDFYKSFQLPQHYVTLTTDGDASSPSTTLSPLPETPTVSLFDDLHDNHDIYTNADLMYEVLYQCHTHVPEWATIPFELFCYMVSFSPLTGGYTNLLYSVELHPEYLTPAGYPAERCESLRQLLQAITRGVDSDDSVQLEIAPFTTDEQQVDQVLQSFSMPRISRVALRIYGTNEFSNRTCELAMAQLASNHNLSEIVYCSWRHGRITSYLDGENIARHWLDPILFTHIAYLQGKLHAYDFREMFANDAFPPMDFSEAHLIKTLHSWCEKAYSSRIYRAVRAHSKASSRMQPGDGLRPPVPSIFNLFSDHTNELYVLYRPPIPHLQQCVHDTRLSRVVLPLPPDLAPTFLGMLNGHHLPQSEEQWQHVSNSAPSELLASKLTDAPIHVKTLPNFGIAQTEHDHVAIGETIVRFIDLPRMKQEIQWLTDLSRGFYLCTGHNDFHAGNIMALHKSHAAATPVTLAQSATTHSNGHSTESSVDSASTTAIPVSTSTQEDVLSHPPVDLPHLPSVLPSKCIEQLKVIDFEYGGYNYRGFDMANSLNESWIDYSGDFPGFSIDCPHMISTHLLGVYDHSAYSTALTSPAPLPAPSPDVALPPAHFAYQNVDGTLHMDISPDRLREAYSALNTPDELASSEHIQRILLGRFASPANGNGRGSADTPDGPPQGDVVHSTVAPPYRPRDVWWAHCYLIGHYFTKYKDDLHQLKNTQQRQRAVGGQDDSSPAHHDGGAQHVAHVPSLEDYLRAETPQLLYEATVMQLASLLLWSFWGVIMSDTTHIQGFGYLEHALERMVVYVAKKELLLGLGLLRPPGPN